MTSIVRDGIRSRPLHAVVLIVLLCICIDFRSLCVDALYLVKKLLRLWITVLELMMLADAPLIYSIGFGFVAFC